VSLIITAGLLNTRSYTYEVGKGFLDNEDIELLHLNLKDLKLLMAYCTWGNFGVGDEEGVKGRMMMLY
jgi:hypothetical protein